MVDGKETLIRYREGYDPYVEKGKGLDFYGNERRAARPLSGSALTNHRQKCPILNILSGSVRAG